MPRRWNKVHHVTTFVNQIRPSSSSSSSESPASLVHVVVNNCEQLNNNISSCSSSKNLDSVLDSFNTLFFKDKNSVSGKEICVLNKTQSRRNRNGSFPFIIFIIPVILVFVFGTKKVAFGFTLLAFLLWFLEVLLKWFGFNRVTTAAARHLDKHNNLVLEEMVVVNNFVGFREEFNDMIKDKENKEIAENRGEGDGEGDSVCAGEEQVESEEKDKNGDEEEEMMVVKDDDRADKDTNQFVKDESTERTKSVRRRAVERKVVEGYPPLAPSVGLEVDEDRIQYGGIPQRMSSAELREKKSKKYVVKKLWSEKFVVKKFGSKNKRSKNEDDLDPSIVQFGYSSDIENVIVQEKNEKDSGKLERARSAEIRREQIKKYFKKLRSKNKNGKDGKFDPDSVRFDCCSGKERMIRGRSGVKLGKDEEESIREAKRRFGDGYDLMNALEVNDNRIQNGKEGGIGRTTSAELKMKQFKQFVSKKFGRDSKRRGDKEGSLNQRTLHFDCSTGSGRVTGEYIVEEQVKNQEDKDRNNEVEAKFGDGYRSISMSEVNEMLGDEYALIDVTNNNEDPNARHGDLRSVKSAEAGENKLQKFVIKKVESEKFTVKKFGGEEPVTEKSEGECVDGRGNKDDELDSNNEQFCCSPETQGLITGGREEEEDHLESPEDSQSDDEEPESEIVYQYDSICVSESSSDMIIQENSGRSTDLSQHSFIPIVIILAGLLNGRIMALVLILLWFLLIKLHNQLQATHTTEVNSYRRKSSIKKSC